MARLTAVWAKGPRPGEPRHWAGAHPAAHAAARAGQPTTAPSPSTRACTTTVSAIRSPLPAARAGRRTTAPTSSGRTRAIVRGLISYDLQRQGRLLPSSAASTASRAGVSSAVVRCRNGRDPTRPAPAGAGPLVGPAIPRAAATPSRSFDPPPTPARSASRLPHAPPARRSPAPGPLAASAPPSGSFLPTASLLGWPLRPCLFSLPSGGEIRTITEGGVSHDL